MDAKPQDALQPKTERLTKRRTEERTDAELRAALHRKTEQTANPIRGPPSQGTGKLKPGKRYLTAPQTRKRYGDLSERGFDSWVADPTLEFPRPLYVNRRRYFAEDELEEWERARASRGR